MYVRVNYVHCVIDKKVDRRKRRRDDATLAGSLRDGGGQFYKIEEQRN